MRLLLAEDTRLVREPLVHALQRAGWAVDAAEDGERALALALSVAYDAVVLDIMLPAMDGLQVLADLRASGSEVPVILLTARSGMRDRVRGLDMGADDYLPKPFHVAELLARLRAVTRRRGASDPSQPVEALGLAYDPVTHVLAKGESRAALTGKEGLVLECLMRGAGRPVTRAAIEDAAWGAGSGSSGRLEAQVSLLRAKLRDLNAGVQICSVRGVGYELKEVDDA